MSDPQAPSSRRQFLYQSLLFGGATMLLSGCEGGRPPSVSTGNDLGLPPAPALPDGLNPADFIQHGLSPLTLETRRDRIGMGGLTATSLLFVRNNLPLPPLEIVKHPKAWRVVLSGLVNDAALAVSDLQRLGVESLVTVLQCSGNGRGFFPHAPSGSPWKTGAAGCVIWTGVPLHKVVAHLGGVEAGKRYLTATGGEVLPEGVDPKKATVERSIPIEKALRDCMLVWEINGQPLPISHGGPLRLIVPGYYGCNQIKYVKQLAFTEEQSTVKMQRSSYRIRPIGASGSPDQPSMWRMNVKSWLNGPGADGRPIPEGQTTFYGVAFSGERAVTQVEYSSDSGRTWQLAEFFGPDLGVHAWRSFRFTVPLSIGKHTFATRATDASGEVQPEQRMENHRGYANNSWKDLALTVEVRRVDEIQQDMGASNSEPAPVVPAVQPKPSSSNRPEQALFHENNCGTCHALADAGSVGAVGPNLDQLKPSAARVTDAVTNGVGVMPSFGQQMTAEEIQTLANYIADVVR